MTSWFETAMDPLGLLRSGRSEPPPDSERDWLEPWLQLTGWWVDTASATTSAVGRYSAARVLPEIVDGVARRFQSRRVELALDGLDLVGELDALRLAHHDGHEVLAELRNVTVGDKSLDFLRVAAHDVRLDLSGPPRLATGRVDISFRAPMAEIVRWIDDDKKWELGAPADGILRASHAERRLHLSLEPLVRPDEVTLEVREMAWKNFSVRVPGWLRLRRTVRPSLPTGWRLLGAVRHGEQLEVQLSVDGVGQALDLRALRRAIASGRTLPLDGISDHLDDISSGGP